jgi:hypothetical protein
MLPSNEQDYTQEYFKALFPKSIRLLQESKVLVVVGYSLPEEDALIRFLIKQFAEDRTDGDNKEIFYIDLSKESEQLEKVAGVFPHCDELRGLKIIPFSGSFNEWVKSVLKAIRDQNKKSKRIRKARRRASQHDQSSKWN